MNMASDSIKKKTAFLLSALFLLLCAPASYGRGIETRNPIVIIPGLTGSELINGETNELVWFKPRRSKDDDLRLPISSTVLARNRDKLVPGDIIRGVQIVSFLPEVEIYRELIAALEKRAAYREGKWSEPPKEGIENTFFVFPYDWRRDNVENARELIRRIEAMKRSLDRPDLRFDIIAHSMGGLISRYAAMYGNAELPNGKLRPTWAGARHLDQIFLLGTPNEGSASALNTLVNGYSLVPGGVNLPFIQDLSPFDVFTAPSMYQLLPHDATFRVFDERLRPIDVDLYDVGTWEEFGWAIWKRKDFEKGFNITEAENARPFFKAALNRAERFQAALSANSEATAPVAFYLMGSDCRETPDGVVLYQDKKGRWHSLFKAESYERADGIKVTKEEVRKVIYTNGDGVVPLSSLKARTAGNPKILPVVAEAFQCESHSRLVTNTALQDRLFALLFGTAAVQ